jgi:hypothetical protein
LALCEVEQRLSRQRQSSRGNRVDPELGLRVAQLPRRVVDLGTPDSPLGDGVQAVALGEEVFERSGRGLEGRRNGSADEGLVRHRPSASVGLRSQAETTPALIRDLLLEM